MLEISCNIGGEAYSSGNRLPIQGMRGDVIASIPALDDYSLTKAVRAARAAKPILHEMPCSVICSIFAKAAHLYDERYDAMIALARGNTLKQVRTARANVKSMLLNFSMVVQRTFEGMYFQAIDVGTNSRDYFYEPVGIVAIFPSSTTREVAPHAILSALAAGNPVIVKADSKEPFSALELAHHLYSAGLPPGALSILLWNTREKPEMGSKLVKIADKSVLFGFDETIKRIAYPSLSNMSPEIVAGLPLPDNIVAFGTGRSKSLIFDCQDMEKAAESIARSVTYIPSACMKTQFVVIEDSRKDDFIRAYSQIVSGLRSGDLLDNETDVGQTIPGNREMVNLGIKNTIAFGAQKVIGTDIYAEPTLFENVHPESVMFKEELPAPSVGLVTVKTLDDAIDLINSSVKFSSSRKSLSVSVYSENRDAYRDCLRRINAFRVLHNKPTHDMDIFTPHQGIFLMKELAALKAC